jgi:hypothetical protein
MNIEVRFVGYLHVMGLNKTLLCVSWYFLSVQTPQGIAFNFFKF